MSSKTISASDLLPIGTYKISDGTMKVNGSVRKIRAIEARAGTIITSGKYTSTNEEETALDLELLTVALEVGEFVEFQHPLHELVIAGAPAMAYFI